MICNNWIKSNRKINHLSWKFWKYKWIICYNWIKFFQIFLLYFQLLDHYPDISNVISIIILDNVISNNNIISSFRIGSMCFSISNNIPIITNIQLWKYVIICYNWISGMIYIKYFQYESLAFVLDLFIWRSMSSEKFIKRGKPTIEHS